MHNPTELPKNYDAKASEQKWQQYWIDNGIFRFDPDSKAEVYSVDTPPPTVSGKMHIGHAFSFSQQDFIVRFKRMKGFNIFCPFGTDDNGLATERLVEKLKGVKARDMPREAFVKLCEETLAAELRPSYLADWKRIGMSCDWEIFYTTINEHCQRISQWSFIELFKQGRAYRKEAPAMWCPECQTGISQVECQDKILDSHFNDIIFMVGDEKLLIATTRPELLPACAAVFYHPDDKRYQKFKGRKAKVPLFNREVPIMPDERADPEKGTGIAMCCTFGDQTDMEWQKAHNLPIIEAISKDGKMTAKAGKYEGCSIGQQPIKHAVNVHERCGTEIEFLTTKQWFIRYLDLKKEMLGWGNQLKWHPEHMKVRYEHWVKGLQWDWLISRQRYFGVPFPVWYCAKCEHPIFADEKALPVDPLKDKPPVKECPKCKCREIAPEKDVLDTWATSSLTPQLSTWLFKDKPIFKKLFPMSLRPQAHDIITFWLFNTAVKSQLHFRQNPWKEVIISGHALDPLGKKMSKSKGNVVEPQAVVEKYSADALRFWAATSKLGEDLPYMEKDIVTGQKFVTKLWNASKFAIMHLQDYNWDFAQEKPRHLEEMDKWLLSKLSTIIRESTESFESYEYYQTKMLVENFFWHDFCDNYLEIAKDRLYNAGNRGKEARESAQYTLYHAALSILKMIAPIMPHITEEIYHLYFAKHEQGIDGDAKDGKARSIHISRWPEPMLHDKNAEELGNLVVFALQQARRAKAEKNLSLKTPIKKMVLQAKFDIKDFEKIKDDLAAAAVIQDIDYFALPKESEKDFQAEVFL
ncbi:valine--tRNA ligase [Candidatus Woesearchaeota archaeon]|nr:valine--tRNA ligase [Candidatus Woesearchaeota archaeon]